jgi:NAD+ synthase (glutamine-hydrolysing)
MKIALAQINPTVGDFDGNAALIRDAAARAKKMGADLAVFPELSLMAYPPRDLVEHRGFVERGLKALEKLAAEIELPSLVGFVSRNESGKGRPLHNSAAFLNNGRIESVTHKMLLPTYDVFDEDRYFEPGPKPTPIVVNGRKLAVTICEDLWRSEGDLAFRYPDDPVEAQVSQGAEAILNLSASPFTQGKGKVRRNLIRRLAQNFAMPLIYVNQVGGNDELVFDGGSMVVDGHGNLVLQAKTFGEDLVVVDLDNLPAPLQPQDMRPEEAAYRAIVLGTRDYHHKCGFRSAVLGLSGGIDSALTAAIAADALGPDNVLGVAMPSRFSSDHSIEDAEILAKNLGIRFRKIPIEHAHNAFLDMLAPAFEGMESDVAEENIQARCRGVILMALANKFQSLTLATGNKSEIATGYCTLYGDMCGGLAPINDLPKDMVYRLSRWLNRNGEIIPQNTIDKPPSAELRPNQVDQDTLPPYDELDRVLSLYIEEQKDFNGIVADGIDPKVAADVIRRIEINEYKRRQAVPGLKITSKAFGYGRRVPIAKHVPRFDV